MRNLYVFFYIWAIVNKEIFHFRVGDILPVYLRLFRIAIELFFQFQ